MKYINQLAIASVTKNVDVLENPRQFKTPSTFATEHTLI